MMLKNEKKERLLKAAKQLIYRQGFRQTTLAEISQESGISLGNLYYYFKTKEEILFAVVENQAEKFKAFAADLEQNPDPKNRLFGFLKNAITARNNIANFGCPVGSLSQELSKTTESRLDDSLNLLKTYVDWASEQFQLMGKQDANLLGRQFIATLQGGCLLANAFKDPEVFVEQAEAVKAWVDSL